MTQSNANASKKGQSRASYKRKKNKEKKQKHQKSSNSHSEDSRERQSKTTEQLNDTNKIEKSTVTDVNRTQSKDEGKPATTRRKSTNKIKNNKNEKEIKETKTSNEDLRTTNVSKESLLAREIEELLQEPVLTLSNEQREKVTSFYEVEQQRSNISITSCTGVQFQDIKVGRGRLAQKHDVVTFRYIGYLGKLHGSTFDKGLLSIRFGFREIIPGLEEGLATMRSKGKRLIMIPPSLAYGEAGNEKIPPNSTLAFVVDIVRIGSKKKNLEEQQTKKRK